MLQHRRLAPVQPNRGSGVRAVAGDGRDCAATAYQRLAHVAADETTASKYHNPTTGAEGYQRKHAHDSRDEHYGERGFLAVFALITEYLYSDINLLLYHEEGSVPQSNIADLCLRSLTEIL